MDGSSAAALGHGKGKATRLEIPAVQSAGHIVRGDAAAASRADFSLGHMVGPKKHHISFITEGGAHEGIGDWRLRTAWL